MFLTDTEIRERLNIPEKPALTQIIEIIGDRSDGCSRYGLIAPPSVAARQNGGGRG